MAIQCNPAVLAGPFSFISAHDSAVDTEKATFADEWRRYVEGAPGAEPPLKEGEEPTVWELTPITSVRLLSQLRGVLDEHGRTAWCIATAAFAITGVEGLLDDSGKPMQLKYQRHEGFTTLTEAMLDMIGGAVLADIGVTVINHKLPNVD